MTATTPPLTPTVTLNNLPTDRAQIAALKLPDIIKTLPKECFEKKASKAWASVLITIAATVVGYLGIVYLPWYCLPITWIWTGTALTGWFVIGHDCGHRSFAKTRWVNDLVGHIAFAPLIYPFHPWRLGHDHHHLHTNKLEEDNAWSPWTVDAFRTSPAIVQLFYRAIRGKLWWIGSIFHWALTHFKLSNFARREHGKVKLSIAVVVAVAAIGFPSLIWATGVWGFVKFWLMPWLVYHFWMSTFTLVHHTLPEIQFRPAAEWSGAEAQLMGTVHCDYPRWVEILCHDINVHIPHHLSVAIPSYNLRLAHKSIQQNWGSVIIERTFNWSLMKQISNSCHLYDAENAYQPFAALKTST